MRCLTESIGTINKSQVICQKKKNAHTQQFTLALIIHQRKRTNKRTNTTVQYRGSKASHSGLHRLVFGIAGSDAQLNLCDFVRRKVNCMRWRCTNIKCKQKTKTKKKQKKTTTTRPTIIYLYDKQTLNLLSTKRPKCRERSQTGPTTSKSV